MLEFEPYIKPINRLLTIPGMHKDFRGTNLETFLRGRAITVCNHQYPVEAVCTQLLLDAFLFIRC
jgi:hypothetical protein